MSTDIKPHLVDPLEHVQYLSTPLLIQHARGDRPVPYQWPENLVIELFKHQKSFRFYSFDTGRHLFKGEIDSLPLKEA